MEEDKQLLRDIDRIIAAVHEQLPDVQVQQLHKIHPTDDDGRWWFSLSGVRNDIQIENSYGNCPFVVETEEQSSCDARKAYTIAEAVTLIVEYLALLRKENSR